MNRDEPYELPQEIVFTFSLPMILLFVVMGIGFLLFPLISVTDPEAPRHIFLLGIASPFLGLLFLWAPIYQNILKKVRATVSEEGIVYYRNKKVMKLNFCDVSHAEVFAIQNNKFIGFRTHKDIASIENGDVSTNFNASMGGAYSLTLPYAQIRSHDKERFLNTLNKCITECDTAPQHEIEPEQTTPVVTNIPKALLISFAASTFGAMIYFLTISFFNINIMVLPALLMWGVIHYFGKSIAKEDYTLPLRLWITALAVYIVLLARLLLLYSDFFAEFQSFSDVIAITIEYFIFLITNTIDEIQWIITALISAGISFYQLSSLGIFRKKTGKSRFSSINE